MEHTRSLGRRGLALLTAETKRVLVRECWRLPYLVAGCDYLYVDRYTLGDYPIYPSISIKYRFKTSTYQYMRIASAFPVPGSARAVGSGNVGRVLRTFPGQCTVSGRKSI
jgi:hypothetical protein